MPMKKEGIVQCVCLCEPHVFSDQPLFSSTFIFSSFFQISGQKIFWPIILFNTFRKN